MCTLSFIPKNDSDFVLTQNRDEAPDRLALAPYFYTIGGTKLLFPKDALAGGTWIGVSEKNRVVSVLNGAFELHERKSCYRMSRGQVANDFMVSDDITRTIDNYNFNDIEPFTIVIVDWNVDLKLYELVWDGEQKHISTLPLEPKIWSSSTLYNEEMKATRNEWFEDFKSENNFKANTILNFHKSAGIEIPDYGVVMDRGFVKTTSITQVEKCHNTLRMSYEQLDSDVITSKLFKLPQAIDG